VPGICGVCSIRSNSEAATTAKRMLSTMRHHSWYRESLHVTADRRFAGGTLTLDDTPAIAALAAERALPVVMLDGEVYDYDAQRRSLELAGCRFEGDSDAELIAHGYQAGGDTFFSQLEGHFSLALWDERRNQLILTSDRLGLKPLYYAALDDEFLFASEIKALLTHPRVPRTRSLRGIAQFFTYGQLLDEETLFDRIHAVPAATLIVFDAARGRTARRQFWRLEQSRPITHTEDALARLERALCTAVARRTSGGGQLGLSLSGGLDARTVLAVVPRDSGPPIKTVSLGLRGSIDHRAASRLAQLAGAKHHCHYLERDFVDKFPQHVQTLVHLTDGHYLDQAITVPTLAVYRNLGIDVLLRGHAGELFHMDKAYAFSIRPEELDFQDRASVERWLWSHLTVYMIGGIGHEIFRKELREEVEQLARQSLTHALEPTAGFDPPAQAIWYMFVMQRLRRETGMSMQLFNSVVQIRLPYVDTDLTQLVMDVPPTLKIGDQIQSHILRQQFPAFMRVINANTGTALGTSRLSRQLATFRLRVFSKLRIPGYQPYERLGLWLSGPLKPLLVDLLLSERSLDRGLFDRGRVTQMIEDHSRRQRNHTFILMAMLIFELGQRQFVDQRPSTVTSAR
jgi:asparagine synthase (glutamine-hydrolysing)